MRFILKFALLVSALLSACGGCAHSSSAAKARATPDGWLEPTDVYFADDRPPTDEQVYVCGVFEEKFRCITYEAFVEQLLGDLGGPPPGGPRGSDIIEL